MPKLLKLLVSATRISQCQIRSWHILSTKEIFKQRNIQSLEQVPIAPALRFYSIKNEVNFDDVVSNINKSKTFIIDVRKPDEVKSTGQIPSSINIPLIIYRDVTLSVDNLKDVLGKMSEEEFKRTFKRSKPTQAEQLIFYCKSGKRASKALETALSLGYNQSKKYLGSWDEWSARRK